MYTNLKIDKVEDASKFQFNLYIVNAKSCCMLKVLNAKFFYTRLLIFKVLINYINGRASNSQFGSNYDDESISSVDEGMSPPLLFKKMADLEKVMGYDLTRLNMENSKPW
jgi:hypothetical protein